MLRKWEHRTHLDQKFICALFITLIICPVLPKCLWLVGDSQTHCFFFKECEIWETQVLVWGLPFCKADGAFWGQLFLSVESRITWYCVWLTLCKKTVLLFEKAHGCVTLRGFGCFLVGVLVFCLSCGCVSASPSGECMLWFVERTGANLGFAPQLAVNVALPKCWFYFLGRAFRFSVGSGLAALAVWVFPRNLQCLPAGLRVSALLEWVLLGFLTHWGEGLWRLKSWGGCFPPAWVELTCGLFRCDLWIICPQVSL